VTKQCVAIISAAL